MFEMLLSGKSVTPTGNLKKFQAGSLSIGALSTSGNLYTIGDMYASGTGATRTTWGLLASGIEDFWMGYRAMLMKTTDGRWLFMGNNQYMPSNLPTNITTPTDVSSAFVIPVGLTIKDITISLRSLAVVFTNGQYAMMGNNSTGGLGAGGGAAVRTLTMRTDYTDVNKIVFDFSTTDTSYMLRNNGTTYGAGGSAYGQLQTTGNLSTWTLMNMAGIGAGTVLDIIPATDCVFRIYELSTGYGIYANGRQFDGSLGTGQTASTNIITPTSVASFPKTGGVPTVYGGLYSARYINPANGAIFYTGTASGSMNGGGATFTGYKYVFTQMPAATIWGAYTGTREAYITTYVVKDNIVYGCGSAAPTYGLLPGLTGSVLVYTPIDLSPVV